VAVKYDFKTEEVDLLRKLDKGRYDIRYFAREILGINTNPSQDRWYELANVGEDGYSWETLYSIHVAANQVGKTLGMGIIILWAGFYKIGVPHTDAKAWFDRPYQWFHVAPSQNQAYLTLQDIRLILRSAHPAQEKAGKRCILPDGFVRDDIKIENYYDGLTFWNGSVVQFRTTEEKARALLGRRANGISFDECAFENHLMAVVNEVLMMRLISTGGPLMMVSTPNGMNDYYELVTQLQDRGAHVGLDEQLWRNLSLKEGLTWSTIADNIGYGFTQEEVDRFEAGLDESTKEQQLRGAFLNATGAFFVPQEQIEKAFVDLPNRQSPRPGHRYIIFFDPSDEGGDPTAIIVMDITTKPWQGVYFEHQAKPIGVNRLLPVIWGLHNLYNGSSDRLGRVAHSMATTGFDATSMGGSIIRHSLVGLSPLKPLNFGGTSKIKRDALNNLRSGMLMGEIQFPKSWTRLRREVLNYRLEDKDIQQDSVMAAAGASAIARSGATPMAAVAFRPHAVVNYNSRRTR